MVTATREHELKLAGTEKEKYLAMLQEQKNEFENAIWQSQGEIEGYQEVLDNERVTKLLPVYDRIQKRKDQPTDVTLKEYREITGKRRPHHVKTDKFDREYVDWTDALDEVVTEYGYDTPEELYDGLEMVANAQQEINHLKKTIRNDQDDLNRINALMKDVKRGKYHGRETNKGTDSTATGGTGSKAKDTAPKAGSTGQRTESESVAAGTAVQTGLTGLGTSKPVQVEAFAEFSGKTGKKETLVDVEKIKAQQAAKPLPGQTKLPEAKQPVKTKIKKTKEAEGKVYTKNELEQRQANRSRQSQIQDLSQAHKITVVPASQRARVWVRDPGSMDIEGIDTVNRGTVNHLRQQKPTRTIKKKRWGRGRF